MDKRTQALERLVKFTAREQREGTTRTSETGADGVCDNKVRLAGQADTCLPGALVLCRVGWWKLWLCPEHKTGRHVREIR